MEHIGSARSNVVIWMFAALLLVAILTILWWGPKEFEARVLNQSENDIRLLMLGSTLAEVDFDSDHIRLLEVNGAMKAGETKKARTLPLNVVTLKWPPSDTSSGNASVLSQPESE
ncbi:MAG: hypothetical protein JNK74_23575 [Candidatus Hydrogenedentes bacterium]|nr:hypothetical protein [Candidatus Hydrogenedentota bacterium]